MTLIVTLKHKDGVVLACDSRAVFELALMRNEERKLTVLGDEIVVVGAGMAGIERKAAEEVRLWYNSTRSPAIKEVVEKFEDIVWDIYQKYKERFEEDEEGGGFPSFILARHDKIFRIYENGYAEEEDSYACEGSGVPYGEYILSQRFTDGMTEEEAKKLAAYAIIQTSRIDATVGGKVNIISLKKGCIQTLNDEEVNQILTEIKAIETLPERGVQKIVEEIVEKRRWINAKFKERFGFELFEQNESAISGIQKTCETESDFTNSIAMLALLIGGVNVSALDEMIGDHPPGSINALETFLNEKYPEFNKKIITNLREIMTLRSKKMPIHEDDPKIVQVLLKWEYKIPPNWSSLWIKALQKFKESIIDLGQLL